MASNYPAGLDSFTTIGSSDTTSTSVGGKTHRAMHNDANDAIEAIQAELGTDPAGSESTVKDRIAATETVANAAVPKSLFDANTILAADSDNTPAALSVAASRIVGRKASGGIGALTAAEVKAILGYAFSDLSGTVATAQIAADARPLLTATRAKVQAGEACSVVCIGDSITEGASSSALGSRWVDLLQDKLNAAVAHADVATPGYVPIYFGSPSAPSLSSVVSITGGSNEEVFGLGRRDRNFTTVGNTVSFTVTGTDARIHYGRRSSPNDAGQWRYRVDAGSWTTVTTSGASAADLATSVFSLGASGSHTVEIELVSGRMAISGLEAWDGNTTSGFHVVDGAHGGYSAADHVTSAGARLGQPETNVDPDLVVVMLGANDRLDSTQAQMITALESILDALPTTADVLMLGMYDRTAAISAANHSAYVEAMRSVAAERGHAFVDLRAFMPDTARKSGLYASDLVHPSNSGHERMAEIVATTILQGITGSSPAPTTTPAVQPSWPSPAGQWVQALPAVSPSNNAVGSISVGQAWLWPMRAAEAMTISDLQINVAVADATGTVTWRLAAYGPDDQLIADLGTINPGTTGAKKITGLDVDLPAGTWQLMLAVQGSGTPTTTSAWTAVQPGVPVTMGTTDPTGGSTYAARTATGVTGAAPSAWSGTGRGAALPPMCNLKRSA